MSTLSKLLASFSLLRKPGLDLPNTLRDIGTYQQNFEQALTFSKSCGFASKNIRWMACDLLDGKGEFLYPVFKAAGVQDVTKSAFQCLKWSHYLAPYFERQLGCNVWPTIGQLWKGEQVVFDPSWDDLRRWVENGVQLTDFEGRQGLNLHAWLTIETGEIIELTHLSSLSKINPNAYGEFSGAVVWGRDPNILTEHRYFPMAAGRELCEAIGEKSFIPIIATNTEELHAYMAFIC